MIPGGDSPSPHPGHPFFDSAKKGWKETRPPRKPDRSHSWMLTGQIRRLTELVLTNVNIKGVCPAQIRHPVRRGRSGSVLSGTVRFTRSVDNQMIHTMTHAKIATFVITDLFKSR